MAGERLGKSSSKLTNERRIVRRSRLLKVLEETSSRTVLLVAPAGYGKTTLARQWLEHAGGAWVSVTNASSDIPVLARDIAAALAEVVEFDPMRVEAALGAGTTSGEQVTAVTRTILTQIRKPVEGWIVIDDYHLLTSNPSAEALVEALERSERFKIIVTSRERPSWATPRRRLYLEILEIGLGELALDDSEVEALLPTDQAVAALQKQARGWPAVIALAGHAKASGVSINTVALSEALYDYFAEELFERAPAVVQQCLMAIAVLPPLDPDELAEFLHTTEVASQAVSTGLAYHADGRIEVHPLARAFLLTKLLIQEDASRTAERAFALALAKGLYDHAFGLIKDTGLDQCLAPLIRASYSHLVAQGRVATLDTVARYAAVRGSVPNHLLDLIGSEMAVRDGDFDRARDLGLATARSLADGDPLKGRALVISGQAAQQMYRYREAFDHHARATEYAVVDRDLADAAWGKFLAAAFLEDGREQDAMNELESITTMDAAQRVRLGSARLLHARLTGNRGPVRSGSEALQYLSDVTDPLIRSGWTNAYGYSLMLQAHYQEARLVLMEARAELAEFGLSFGTPHIEWTLAAAELGLRHFSKCDALLRRVEQSLTHNRDTHLELNARSLRARLNLSQQRPSDAIKVTADEFERYPSRSMYGEYIATRALALAVIGEKAAATAASRRASELTGSVDSRILCAAANAVLAVDEAKTLDGPAKTLLETASEFDAWDGVVCAVRASPSLLGRLALSVQHRTQLRDVLLRSNDVILAKSVGLVTRATGRRGVLSPREEEILEHVSQGRKNAEIAKSLFISAGTVKSHMDHVFDKLGVRTRAEAVARYAEYKRLDGDDA